MSTKKCAQCDRTSRAHQLKSTMWIVGACFIIAGFAVVTTLCWLMLEDKQKAIAVFSTCGTMAVFVALLHEVISCNWVRRDVFHFVDQDGRTHRHLDSPEESEQVVVLVEHIGRFERWFQVFRNGVAAQAQVVLEESDEQSVRGTPATYMLVYPEITLHHVTLDQMMMFFESSPMVEFLARKCLVTCVDGERLGNERDRLIGAMLMLRRLVSEYCETFGNSVYGSLVDWYTKEVLTQVLTQDVDSTATLFRSKTQAWTHLAEKAITRFGR